MRSESPNPPEDTLYMGSYSLRQDQPLYRQLSRLSGLGLGSSLGWLDSLGVPDPYSVTWNSLDPALRAQIQSQVSRQTLETPGNRGGETALGNLLKSLVNLDHRRKIRKGSYQGLRIKHGKKVRGQRTRSTGRKHKILRGFQKKKAHAQKTKV